MKPIAHTMLSLFFACLLAATTGCDQPKDKVAATEPVALCTSCGLIKGTAECCKPGQATCANCGLVKESPSCCRISKGSTEPVFLCSKCGHIKGTAECCVAGQPTCAKCGLVKGSPGCCKLPEPN